MSEMKNINMESKFNKRTGLVVWLKNKRNVKRLMNYGFLHYISNKMNYALLYVDSVKQDEIIKKIEKEHMVQSVEISKMKDLPITYDEVLPELKKKNEDQKKIIKEESDDFLSNSSFLNFENK